MVMGFVGLVTECRSGRIQEDRARTPAPLPPITSLRFSRSKFVFTPHTSLRVSRSKSDILIYAMTLIFSRVAFAIDSTEESSIHPIRFLAAIVPVFL